jgi:ParB family chromosome partitioning protein
MRTSAVADDKKTLQEIPIALIDIPKGWRKVNKPTVAEIAESVTVDGLLQPIGLRAVGDRYRLVFGRHRLEAFKSLSRAEIPAFVLELTDEGEAGATDAENLFRAALTPANRLLCMKRWQGRYAAENPESAVRGRGIGESPDRFDVVASAVTGVPEKTIRNQLATAKKLTEDELFTLADREVKPDQIEALAKLKDADQKRAAISLIASGLDAKLAIATATAPQGAVVTDVTHQNAPVKADVDMTDDEWIETYCGDLLGKLKYQAIYRRDAVLYRETSQARARFKADTKKALARSKGQLVGPLYLNITKLVNMDHPKNWKFCGPCGGSGKNPATDEKCGACRGQAFTSTQGGLK